MIEPSSGVGARLRSLRKLRGMTQHQLAAATSFSVSLIKKVERTAVPPSAALVAGAARALGVTPGYLYGIEERDAVEQPYLEIAGVAELRRALDAWDDPQPQGEPLPLTFVDERLTAIAGQVYRLRYGDAAIELAGLLHHLYVLADAPEPDSFQARAALHDAYRLAATVAGRFRQADLAAIASERHIQLAPLTGDPQRMAISAFHRSTRLLRLGNYSAGLRVIERARGQLDVTPDGRAVGIQLDLRAGVLSARAGDLDQADGFIQEARARFEEQHLPVTPYRGIDASSVNILAHWCAAPVDKGNGAEAVRRAGQVDVVDPERPERVAHHYIDLGRAYLLAGDRTNALASLQVARHIDPHNTQRHPSVRETILAIAEHDRRTTESLSSLARWAGVSL